MISRLKRMNISTLLFFGSTEDEDLAWRRGFMRRKGIANFFRTKNVIT